MTDVSQGAGWGDRIGRALLTLASALGRRVTLEEFGQLIGDAEGRDQPYTKAAVSMWVAEKSEPALRTFEAIAQVVQCDPWYLAWGVGRPPSNVVADYFTPVPRDGGKKAAAKKKRAR